MYVCKYVVCANKIATSRIALLILGSAVRDAAATRFWNKVVSAILTSSASTAKALHTLLCSELEARA